MSLSRSAGAVGRSGVDLIPRRWLSSSAWGVVALSLRSPPRDAARLGRVYSLPGPLPSRAASGVLQVEAVRSAFGGGSGLPREFGGGGAAPALGGFLSPIVGAEGTVRPILSYSLLP